MVGLGFYAATASRPNFITV